MLGHHNDCSLNAEDRARRRVLRGHKAVLAASAAVCVGASLSHWWQPDWLAPVALVPPLYWLVIGLGLTAYGMSRRHKLWSLAMLTLWLAYAVVLVEETWSLARIGNWPTPAWNAARERGRGIRVVSLNCAGNRRAAAEVAKWEPDIVLLQESPSREDIDQISQEMFGADGTALWGGDTSLLVRGHIQPRHVNSVSHFVHATVELPSGLTADVISLRLNPPVFRLDFWMPGFWIDHRDNRARHRKEILEIMQRIERLPQSTPLIVGGDFNAPPSDAAFAALQPRLYDTFRNAGHGWGNTGTNDVPLFRVDQIWVSRQFRAESVTTQKTIFSDHRMVVCDLILE